MSSDLALESSRKMGRKKGEKETVLMRVYKNEADEINQAASERRLTVADFVAGHLKSCVEKAHRDYIKAESKRLEGREK